MEIDFGPLVEKELASIYEAIEAFGLDLEVFKKYSEACVMGNAFEEYGEDFAMDGGTGRNLTLAEEFGLPKEEADKFRADFFYLCDLVPILPRAVVGLMGMSYSTLIAVRDGVVGYETPQERVEGLVHASHGRGKAMGICEKAELMLEESFRKSALARAGAKGAALKNARSQELKSWAVERAKNLRGADVDIARKLSAQIPSHLADVSKNPQRLIYETLRKRT